MNGHANSAAAAVLSYLLGQHGVLSCVAHVPLLTFTYQWLHTTFAHRVTEAEAMDFTVLQAMDARLDRIERVTSALVSRDP